MPHVWIPNKAVTCPLCEQPFTETKVRAPNGKVIPVCVCRPCKIVAPPFDPMFNKWRDADKVIPCPECNTPMKWFGRMIDCYMKCECPNCGICIEKNSDMAINKGVVEVEDMQTEMPEVIDLSIPVDKLNISEEQKQGLKKKIRERRGKENGS